MSSPHAEPTWVLNLQAWWSNLIGPDLDAVWSDVRRKAGTPGLLESAYGASVRQFEEQLEELEDDVAEFTALAGQSPWAPLAASAADMVDRVKAQWQDPSATTPTTVSGVLTAAQSVVRGINVAVSAVGVAWALVSLGEVLRARRLLAKWSEHAEAGVDPSRRELRQAGVSGVGFDLDLDSIIYDNGDDFDVVEDAGYLEDAGYHEDAEELPGGASYYNGADLFGVDESPGGVDQSPGAFPSGPSIMSMVPRGGGGGGGRRGPWRRRGPGRGFNAMSRLRQRLGISGELPEGTVYANDWAG